MYNDYADGWERSNKAIEKDNKGKDVGILTYFF